MSIRKHAQILQEQGAREDEPSGSTPRKRTWQFVDRWDTTKSREILLQDNRRKPNPIQDSPPSDVPNPVQAEMVEGSLPIQATPVAPARILTERSTNIMPVRGRRKNVS